MLQRVAQGVAPERWRSADLTDVSVIEWGTWMPLLLLIVVLGFLPFLVLGITNEAVTSLFSSVF
jgi:NADH:ubiquinone oxidoreductase subunit 4 (subunit M)